MSETIDEVAGDDGDGGAPKGEAAMRNARRATAAAMAAADGENETNAEVGGERAATSGGGEASGEVGSARATTSTGTTEDDW